MPGSTTSSGIGIMFAPEAAHFDESYPRHSWIAGLRKTGDSFELSFSRPRAQSRRNAGTAGGQLLPELLRLRN
jgi:hypothetical protein